MNILNRISTFEHEVSGLREKYKLASPAMKLELERKGKRLNSEISMLKRVLEIKEERLKNSENQEKLGLDITTS